MHSFVLAYSVLEKKPGNTRIASLQQYKIIVSAPALRCTSEVMIRRFMEIAWIYLFETLCKQCGVRCTRNARMPHVAQKCALFCLYCRCWLEIVMHHHRFEKMMFHHASKNPPSRTGNCFGKVAAKKTKSNQHDNAWHTSSSSTILQSMGNLKTSRWEHIVGALVKEISNTASPAARRRIQQT